MKTILHIDASARHDDSLTRAISKQVVSRIADDDSVIVHRNADNQLPLLNQQMVEAYFTAPEQRTEAHLAAIAESEKITAELHDAEIIVIGVPIYNFAAPAAFKAWSDLAARAGVTFNYTADGPVGLLQNKKAIVVTASGGTEIGGVQDFLSPWIKHFLAFLGISDSRIWSAAEWDQDADRLIDDFLDSSAAEAA